MVIHLINNKLKCFPYNYLLVSNNIGQNIFYIMKNLVIIVMLHLMLRVF